MGEKHHVPADVTREEGPSSLSDDVAARRRSARAIFADAAAPMVEIDTLGRIVHVAGDWSELVGRRLPESGALMALVRDVDESDAVLDAIEQVLDGGVACSIERDLREADERGHVAVMPIPSAVRDSEIHAVVGLSADPIDSVRVGHDGDQGIGRIATRAVADNEAEPVDDVERPVGPRRAALVAVMSGTEADRPDSGPDGATSSTSDGVDHAAASGTEDDNHDDETLIDPAASPSSASSARPDRRRLLVAAALGYAAVHLLILAPAFGWPSPFSSDEPDPTAPELADEVVIAEAPITFDALPGEPADVTATQRWGLIAFEGLGPVHGIAVAGEQIVAADTSGQIVRLDSGGATVGSVAVGGAESFVSDLAVADDGTIWALDAGTGSLYLIDGTDQVETVTPQGATIVSSRGIAAARGGGVWVASTAGAAVVRVGADGSTIGVVPVPGRQPSDVVELDDGTLWLVDAEKIELVHIQPSGTEISRLPLEGFSSIEAPHLALANDVMWVTHPELSEVRVVDVAASAFRPANGALRRADGGRIDKAIGVAVTDAGTVWVTDSNGRGVAVFDS